MSSKIVGTMNGQHEVTPLARAVQKLVQDSRVLDNYSTKNAAAQSPSESDGVAVPVPEQAPLEVKVARDAVMDGALEIFDLLSGPSKFLSNLTVSVCVS